MNAPPRRSKLDLTFVTFCLNKYPFSGDGSEYDVYTPKTCSGVQWQPGNTNSCGFTAILSINLHWRAEHRGRGRKDEGTTPFDVLAGINILALFILGTRAWNEKQIQCKMDSFLLAQYRMASRTFCSITFPVSRCNKLASPRTVLTFRSIDKILSSCVNG